MSTKYIDCYVSKSKTFRVTEKKLRSVTINQELEKKTFAWKTTLFCNIQGLLKDWKMQSFTFSFVCITSSKLITVSCINKVLSLMWITGRLLKKFSRQYRVKQKYFEACNQYVSKSFLIWSNISRESLLINNHIAIHGWLTYKLSKTFTCCEMIQRHPITIKKSQMIRYL